ncbi:hypothetical protein WA158_006708 [Blastocystis sp. Blastoise]
MEACIKRFNENESDELFLQNLQNFCTFLDGDSVELTVEMKKTIFKSIFERYVSGQHLFCVAAEPFLVFITKKQVFNEIAQNILNLTKKSPRYASDQWYYNVFRLCVILFNKVDTVKQTDVFASELELLRSIIHTNLLHSAMNLIKTSYSEEEKSTLIKKCIENKDTSFYIGALLLSTTKNTNDVKAIADCFMNILSNTRKEIPAVILKGIEVLSPYLTHEFLKDLIPSLSRALKRNPELIVPCLLPLLSTSSVDYSVYISQISQGIFWSLKQADNKLSTLILRNTIKHISDGDAILNFIKDILSQMDSAKLQLDIKNNVYKGIQIILETASVTLSKSEMKRMTTALTPVFESYLEKELAPSTRFIILTIMATCLSSSGIVSSSLSTFFQKAIKTSSKDLTASLIALNYACLNKDTACNFTSLLPSLLPIVQKGQDKPGLFGKEGVLALSLSFLISISSSPSMTIDSSLLPYLESTSFLFNMSIYTTIKTEEIEIIELIGQTISKMIVFYMKFVPTECELLAKLHIQLACSSFHHLRLSANEDLYQLLQIASESIHSLYIHTFVSFLISTSSIPTLPEEPVIPMNILHSCLASIFVGQIPKACLFDLAFACHFNLIVEKEKQCNRVWKFLSYVLVPTTEKDNSRDYIDSLFAEETTIQTVKNFVLGENGIYSSNPACRQATIRSLVTLSTYPSFLSSLFPLLYPTLQEHSDSNLADSLTEEDINIYKTPEMEVYVAKKNDGEYIPEVVYSTNVRKPRYMRKGNAFGADDEAWVEEVKRMTQSEKIAREAAEKALNDKTALLETQQVNRDKVKPIANGYIYTLELLKGLIRIDAQYLYPFLNDCINITISIQNTFMKTLAKDVFIQLCHCIPSVLGSLFTPLYKSLQIILLPEQYDDETHTTLQGYIQSLFDEIIGYLETDTIPAPTFRFFLPIFDYILSHDIYSEYIEDICTILEAHSNIPSLPEEDADIMTVIRPELIKICLRLLKVTPAPTSSPEDILATLCDQPSLNSSEISILIGEQGLLSASEDMRMSIFIALQSVEDPSINPVFIIRLWMFTFDSNTEVEDEAKAQWEEGQCVLPETYYLPLFVLLNHKSKDIREMAARALVGGIKEIPESFPIVFSKLQEMITECFKKATELRVDINTYEEDRYIVFYTLSNGGTEHSFSTSDILKILDYIFNKGIVDVSSIVAEIANTAGENIVDTYGDECCDILMNYLENKLSSLKDDQTKSKEDLERNDCQRETAVVLIAHAVVHLPGTDSRILSTVDTLMNTLSTPSESVQEAVAKCFYLLFKLDSVKQVADKYITLLKQRMFENEDFAERRGACRGITSIFKALSISYMNQYHFLDYINELCNSKNDYSKEAGLYAIQFLSKDFGPILEAYSKQLLPLLMDCFSSKNSSVRTAALAASKMIMKQLTPFGVKTIMPIVQEGLQDTRWRTKAISIQMLGSMAYCNPASLSSCLPTIVPILTEACNDAQPKIVDAAKTALQHIGTVIRTPEIADLQKHLIKALNEPHLYTEQALQVLTDTHFYHTVDAPSLSLIIPILLRGLNERSMDCKRKASLIVGNICALASKEDVTPYLKVLLNPLKKVVVDPQPDIRAVAAHSMGMLTKEMGENEMEDLLNWLIEHIYEDSSVSERSGAAQGLAEVMAYLTEQTFNETLQELMDNFKHPRYYVREGVLWTISFLPNTLKERFPALIPRLLPAIISGLADESDMVAEVSLKAGQVVVSIFGKKEMDHILPQLLEGMMDTDWRIRQSSAQLCGDLLYSIGGIRAVGQAEEETDVGLASKAVEQQLAEICGEVRWHKILAYLFFLTTDDTLAVRQTAFQVWKSVVANTPRTLKTCIEDITTLCFMLLSGEDDNKRTLASRCLGELVSKLAEYVLPKLIPVLQKKLVEADGDTKHGVCLGLVEVISSASSSMLVEYGTNFLESIKISICDDDEKVRECSAMALKELQRRGDGSALQNILPYLLEDLESGDETKTSNGLNGLIQLISIQGKTVIETLFPRLIQTPLTLPRLEALAAVSTVTSRFIHNYNKSICHSLLEYLCGVQESEEEIPLNDKDIEEGVLKACGALCSNCSDIGVQMTCTAIDKISDSINPGWRRNGMKIMEIFISATEAQFGQQIPLLLKSIINRTGESDMDIVKASWAALTALFTRVPDDELLNHVSFMIDLFSSIISQSRHRKGIDATNYIHPALSLPGSLKIFTKCLSKGIVGGSAEVRTQCADLYTELMTYSPSKVLTPLCVSIAGPIIRIVGDRCTPEVKTSLLRTLTTMLEKCGIALKPFVSQLQTTFTKALRDPAEPVRIQGAIALGCLMEVSLRVDILIKELNEDVVDAPEGVKEALLRAISNIVVKVGDKISNDNIHMLVDNMYKLSFDKEEPVRELASSTIGALAQYISPNELEGLLNDVLVYNSSQPWEQRHGRCLLAGNCLQHSSDAVLPYITKLLEGIRCWSTDDHVNVRQATMVAVESILKNYIGDQSKVDKATQDQILSTLIPCFVKLIQDTNSGVRYQAIHGIKRYAKSNSTIPKEIFNTLDSTLLTNYLETIPAADARYLKEYARRVLTKLSIDSDEETF